MMPRSAIFVVLDGLNSGVFMQKICIMLVVPRRKSLRRFGMFAMTALAVFLAWCTRRQSADYWGIARNQDQFMSVRSAVRDMCQSLGIFVIKQNVLLDRFASCRVGQKGWHFGGNPNATWSFFLAWETFLRHCFDAAMFGALDPAWMSAFSTFPNAQPRKTHADITIAPNITVAASVSAVLPSNQTNPQMAEQIELLDMAANVLFKLQDCQFSKGDMEKAEVWCALTVKQFFVPTIARGRGGGGTNSAISGT